MELLVVLLVIGVLATMLLPAVQRARESARRAACESNLRQIGLALTAYEARRGAFPVGCVDCSLPPPHKPPRLTAWGVWLLPHLGESPLADAIDTRLPVHSAALREAIRTPLAVFLCPSVDGEFAGRVGGAYTDYAGIAGLEGGTLVAIPPEWFGAMEYERGVPAREFPDGLSKTAAAGETLLRRGQESNEWANGHNLFAQAADNAVNGTSGLGNDLGSAHPGGALVVRADAGVEFLSDDTDQQVLNALLTRAGEDR